LAVQKSGAKAFPSVGNGRGRAVLASLENGIRAKLTTGPRSRNKRRHRRTAAACLASYKKIVLSYTTQDNAVVLRLEKFFGPIGSYQSVSRETLWYDPPWLEQIPVCGFL